MKIQEAAVPGPSVSQSDFERVFKPFALGKDKILAPKNWFHDRKSRRRRASEARDVIVLDGEEELDDDIKMVELQPTEEELQAMSPLCMFIILSAVPAFMTAY